MDIRAVSTACGCALALVAACVSPARASGPDAGAESPGEVAQQTAHQPWLQPIEETRPLRRMSALKHEYRRIRELRRAQMQPEYERRMASSGAEAADAWRDDTLRHIAKRDLRDLRARLDR